MFYRAYHRSLPSTSFNLTVCAHALASCEYVCVPCVLTVTKWYVWFVDHCSSMALYYI